MPSERQLIASVIYNRLSEGMPLGIDATTRFAVRQLDQPAHAVGARRPSPYNTRINTGLPPGPIGNPGLASIEAAARPASTDYLFYVAKPCTRGAHDFAETDAEFQRAVARYNAGARGAGGHAPTELLTPLAGVLGFPVGHSRSPAMHERGVREPRARLALREAAGPAGAVRGDRARAARLRLPRRERDDPAQGRRARAGRRGQRRRRVRSAPPTRSPSTTARSRRTTPTPAAASSALGESPTRAACARSCSAPAARPRRGLGAARGGRGRGARLEPHARARARSWPTTLGRHAPSSGRTPRTCRERHLGGPATRSTTRWTQLGLAALEPARVVVRPRVPRRRRHAVAGLGRARGRARGRRTRGARPPGRAQLRALDRPGAAARR